MMKPGIIRSMWVVYLQRGDVNENEWTAYGPTLPQAGSMPYIFLTYDDAKEQERYFITLGHKTWIVTYDAAIIGVPVEYLR